MAHAEICPICKGEGTRKTRSATFDTPVQRIKCHGCDGKGWVPVPDEPQKETKFVTNV